MNKRSQVALAFAAGYLLLKMGIAIYRQPVGAVVVFAILTVFSVIGGASASDVVHAIFSFAVILGLVFIIGLACEGRWVAAFLWFIALLIGVAILRGLTTMWLRLQLAAISPIITGGLLAAMHGCQAPHLSPSTCWRWLSRSSRKTSLRLGQMTRSARQRVDPTNDLGRSRNIPLPEAKRGGSG